MNTFTTHSFLNGIGIPVENKNDTIENIFKNSKLDWTVEQENVYSDTLGEIPNTVVNYRSDNKYLLGLVSKSHYKIVNNIDAFKFIDDLPNFEIDRVGSTNGGKQVFVLGKSSETFEITENDTVEQYLTFVHGHTGKNGIQLIISPIRTACTNQLNLLLEKADFKYSIKHAGDIKTKLDKVHKALALNKDYMLELGNRLRGMTTTQATISIDEFLNRLIPDKDETGKPDYRKYEIVSTIQNLYNNKDDNQNYKGTQFGYLNAVADYVSHAIPRKCMEFTRENMFLDTIQNNKLLNEAYKILKAA